MGDTPTAPDSGLSLNMYLYLSNRLSHSYYSAG